MALRKTRMRSEYGGSFRPWREETEKAWRENLRTRASRREREERHEPWAWAWVSDGEEEGHQDFLNGRAETAGGHRTASEEGQEDSEETDSDFDGSGARERKNVFCDTGDDLLARLKERALKRVKEIEGEYSEEQKNQSNDFGRRPHHPLKGAKPTFQRSRSVRPTQKQSLSKSRKSSPINNNKPFLSYGWGSKSEENGRKKTFNINSKIDVYPSAIRALNNAAKRQPKHTAENDENKGRPKTSDGSRMVSGRRKSCRSACSSRSINIDNKCATEWLSEYQQRYPTYANDVYKRCLANLAPRGHFASLDSPRTCRI